MVYLKKLGPHSVIPGILRAAFSEAAFGSVMLWAHIFAGSALVLSGLWNLMRVGLDGVGGKESQSAGAAHHVRSKSVPHSPVVGPSEGGLSNSKRCVLAPCPSDCESVGVKVGAQHKLVFGMKNPHSWCLACSTLDLPHLARGGNHPEVTSTASGGRSSLRGPSSTQEVDGGDRGSNSLATSAGAADSEDFAAEPQHKSGSGEPHSSVEGLHKSTPNKSPATAEREVTPSPSGGVREAAEASSEQGDSAVRRAASSTPATTIALGLLMGFLCPSNLLTVVSFHSAEDFKPAPVLEYVVCFALASVFCMTVMIFVVSRGVVALSGDAREAVSARTGLEDADRSPRGPSTPAPAGEEDNIGPKSGPPTSPEHMAGRRSSWGRAAILRVVAACLLIFVGGVVLLEAGELSHSGEQLSHGGERRGGAGGAHGAANPHQAEAFLDGAAAPRPLQNPPSTAETPERIPAYRGR